MKLQEVINELIVSAYTAYSMKSLTNDKSFDVPGELITMLSQEKRNLLKNFTAWDISLEKIPSGHLRLFNEDRENMMIRSLKQAFDKKSLKI